MNYSQLSSTINPHVCSYRWVSEVMGVPPVIIDIMIHLEEFIVPIHNFHLLIFIDL